MNLDFVERMPEEIADYLLTDPIFNDIGDPTKNVAVIAVKPKDNLNEIQQRIDKLEICALVLVTQASCETPHNGGPFFDEVEIQVGVCDNRLINGTGKTAELIAIYVHSILHGWKPPSANGPLVSGDPAYVEIPPETPADKKKRLVAARFTTSAGVSYKPEQVVLPVIQVGPGQLVNITCATAGATIYYTTNGSAPTNATGTPWAGAPVNLAVGTVIKARAYKAAQRASKVASATIIAGASGQNFIDTEAGADFIDPETGVPFVDV